MFAKLFEGEDSEEDLSSLTHVGSLQTNEIPLEFLHSESDNDENPWWDLNSDSQEESEITQEEDEQKRDPSTKRKLPLFSVSEKEYNAMFSNVGDEAESNSKRSPDERRQRQKLGDVHGGAEPPPPADQIQKYALSEGLIRMNQSSELPSKKQIASDPRGLHQETPEKIQKGDLEHKLDAQYRRKVLSQEELQKLITKFVKINKRDASILYRYLQSNSRKRSKVQWDSFVNFLRKKAMKRNIEDLRKKLLKQMKKKGLSVDALADYQSTNAEDIDMDSTVDLEVTILDNSDPSVKSTETLTNDNKTRTKDLTDIQNLPEVGGSTIDTIRGGAKLPKSPKNDPVRSAVLARKIHVRGRAIEKNSQRDRVGMLRNVQRTERSSSVGVYRIPRELAAKKRVQINKQVTVLCSSSSESILAAEAQNLGACLGRKGYKAICTAYGGVPNALALGVSQAKGVSLGVVSERLYPHLKPSTHFTETVKVETPGTQLDVLCAGTSYYIVLAGGLTPFTTFLSVVTRTTYDNDGVSQIYAIRDPWQGIFESVVKSLRLPSMYKNVIHFVDGADEALGKIDKHYHYHSVHHT